MGPTSKDRHRGRGPSSQVTAARVAKDVAKEDGPSLVIHPGDLSYAHGRAMKWERWFSLIQPTAVRVPYMVSVGNHEMDHIVPSDNDASHTPAGFHPPWGNYGDDSRGECGVPTARRFFAPEGSGHGIFWYSFQHGGVHIVMLSTEVRGPRRGVDGPCRGF